MNKKLTTENSFLDHNLLYCSRGQKSILINWRGNRTYLLLFDHEKLFSFEWLNDKTFNKIEYKWSFVGISYRYKFPYNRRNK